MLYCSVGIIDLNAKVFQEKFLIGCKVDQYLHIDISKAKSVQYSMNEAKLYIVQKASEIESLEQGHPARDRINNMCYVMPLLNSRQMPIF